MKKIRARFPALRPVWLFAVLFAGAVGAAAIRLYQLLTMIEPETGFYTRHNASIPVLYALLAVCAAALIACGYLSARLPQDGPRGKNIPMAVLSTFFAISLLVDSGMQARNFFLSIAESHNAYTQTQYVVLQSALPLLLEAVFAVLACIYFTLFALSCTGFGGEYARYRLLAVMPLLWVVARVVHRLMRTISFRNVSELLLELFMLAAMLLFFMAFARVSSRVNQEGAMWRLYAFGTASALLALTISLPRLCLLIAGKGNLLVAQSPFELCDLASAAFIIGYLMTAAGTHKTADAGLPPGSASE